MQLGLDEGQSLSSMHSSCAVWHADTVSAEKQNVSELSVGEQNPFGPQSASMRQLLLLEPQTFGETSVSLDRHTQTVPGQSTSDAHVSYEHARMNAPPFCGMQRPFLPWVQSESREHDPKLPPSPNVPSSVPRPDGHVTSAGRCFFGTRTEASPSAVSDDASFPPPSPSVVTVPPQAARSASKPKPKEIFIARARST